MLANAWKLLKIVQAEEKTQLIRKKEDNNPSVNICVKWAVI